MNVRTLSVSLALCLPLPSLGATYFVSTIGSDSGAGTQKAPFRHLSRAASAARKPGDTVIVMDGTYDNEGQVATSDGHGSVVNLSYSGKSGSPITFRAQNRGGAILDGMNTTSAYCSGAWAYFDLKNASYIVIQGFVIQHTCDNGIRSNDSAHDITIRWNEIRNIGNWANPGAALSPSGIYMNNSEYDFTFDGNSFHDIGGATRAQEHGIYTTASNVTVINNVFYNFVHGFAIQAAGGANLTIAHNTFAFPNPNTPGQIVLWDDGKAGSLANVTVRDNIFYAPSRVAVVTSLSGPIAGMCAIDHNLTDASRIFDNGSPCSVADNSTNTDPKLVNVSNLPYNFQLQKGSPAIGAGIRLNVSTDFRGAARSSGNSSDIGAYQFMIGSIAPIAFVGSGVTLLPTSVAPGQVISIFGLGLGPPVPIEAQLDDAGMVGTLLGSTRALFDGMAASLIFVSSTEVVAVAPYAIAGQSSTGLEVEFDGAVTPVYTLQVVKAAPTIFTLDSSGTGQAAMLNQDTSVNSPRNPASQSSVVVLYATGGGQMDPSGVDGLLGGDTLIGLAQQVSVTVAGQAAQVTYAGSAPGLAPGIIQVNAQLPEGISPGTEIPIVLKVGDASSADGVTMSVL